MRALVALTVIMGVLILAGTATVAITIVHRIGGTPRALTNALLDEPAGTHILAAAAYGDKLAIVLQGGGPDRVAIIDPATGRALGRIALAR
jgi:hypothetical protein